MDQPAPVIEEHKTYVLVTTVDKFDECNYFLAQMLREYHEPGTFRFNLNAFIQALRNVTFMLQSEEIKPPDFDAWYQQKQAEMREDNDLRCFVNARNLVVKQSMLEIRSICHMGLFRGRRLKMAMGSPVPPCVSSRDYLEKIKNFAYGRFIDEGHSALGEQIGVERIWLVQELGDGEVVDLCANALGKIGILIQEAYALFGLHDFDPNVALPDTRRFRVLLETDVDPSLPEKWGW